MLIKMQSISTLKKKNFGWAQASNAMDAKNRKWWDLANDYRFVTIVFFNFFLNILNWLKLIELDAKSPWKFEIFIQKNVFLFLCMRSIRLEDRDKIGAAKEAWYTYWTC